MAKTCEFCKTQSPIVYCKSDAAHLCLSCDAKVHSANALSYRHPRTLVCESCGYRPVDVQCFVHEMFMCESCDTSCHVSSQHERKVVKCYAGCPSAKELAALWGFYLDELKYESFVKDRSVSCSVGADSDVDSGGSRREATSSLGKKVLKDDNKQQNRYLILQQIQDLQKLQLSEGIDSSCLLHVKERKVGSPFKAHKVTENDIEHFGGQLDFQHTGSSCEDRSEELLSSPFSQNPLQEDTFWQWKSPAHNNEIWLQNMQDLGVCDEVQCFDDVNIPDVDLTFRNFEELFGAEHEPLEDIRPSYSASSFSVSRITGQSSSFAFKDDELSPTYPKYDSENTKLDGKENVMMRYKEKKVLRHEKQAQYTSPKPKPDGKLVNL